MPRTPLQRAAIGALLYVAAGIAWIWISDSLLRALVESPGLRATIQTWKGWLFVLATGLLLFALLYRLLYRDATLARHHARQREELHALSQFRESIIDHANLWISAIDANACVTLWNRTAEEISGYARDEVLGRDDIWERLYPDPDYRRNVTDKLEQILNEGLEIEHLESRIRCRDGSDRVLSWSSRRFLHPNGEMGSIGIGRDVTERRQMRSLLQARDRQLAILMANMPGMVYRRRPDARWTLRFASSGCLSLTGYTADDLVDDRNVPYVSLIHPEDRERIEVRVRRAASTQQPFTLEYRILHRDGLPRWVWEQGRAVHNGAEPLLEGIIVNITDRKRMERQLEQMAVQDPLTGLHNRRELEIALKEQVGQARRSEQPLTLLWIDIDRFKQINDDRGHRIGDEVLRRVAHVIQDHLRAEDFAARYGGDEFVMLLPGMDSGTALRLAETILAAFHTIRVPLEEDGTLSITTSLGLATLPEHAHDTETLTESADRAMYRAKREGRDRVCAAHPSLAASAPVRAGRRPGPRGA